MMHRFVPVLAGLLVALPAYAASNANLAVTVALPANQHVYETGRFQVSVKNNGTRNASNANLTIQLPQTMTSPAVYVLGTLGARTSTCTLSGTRLLCPLGTVNKGATKTVFFDLAIPYAAAAVAVQASVTSSSVENTLADNSVTRTVSLLTYPVSIAPDDAATNDHCTGTGLISYFECTLFPSSISTHATVFNVGGTIGFVDAPATYTGTWAQPAPDRLTFQYFDDGVLVASFDGRGVNSNCFEGKTTFPDSGYVSMYEVCF